MGSLWHAWNVSADSIGPASLRGLSITQGDALFISMMVLGTSVVSLPTETRVSRATSGVLRGYLVFVLRSSKAWGFEHFADVGER